MRNRYLLATVVAAVAAIALTHLLVTRVSGQTTTGAESSAVVTNDGHDNFLILPAEEVGNNSKILAFLSTASKEELEEVVETNPALRKKILERIKLMVEAKERNKYSQANQVVASQDVQQYTNVEPVKSIPIDMPLGMPQETPTAANYDDDDDDDDHQAINKLIVPKINGDAIKKGALKIFKISKGLKVKLKEFLKKSKKKGKKVGPPPVWPLFRYNVSAS